MPGMKSASFPFHRDEAADEAELATLLQACARRDPAALRRLHALTAPQVLAELLQILGEPEAAEAQLAAVYALIWREAGSWLPGSVPARTWLRAITRRLAIGHLHEEGDPLPDGERGAMLRLLADTGQDSPGELLDLAYRSGRDANTLAHALGRAAAPLRAALHAELAALCPEDQAATGLTPRQRLLCAAHVTGLQTTRVHRRMVRWLKSSPAARRECLRREAVLAQRVEAPPPVRPRDELAFVLEQGERRGQGGRPVLPWRWIAALLLGAAVLLWWLRR